MKIWEKQEKKQQSTRSNDLILMKKKRRNIGSRIGCVGNQRKSTRKIKQNKKSRLTLTVSRPHALPWWNLKPMPSLICGSWNHRVMFSLLSHLILQYSRGKLRKLSRDFNYVISNKFPNKATKPMQHHFWFNQIQLHCSKWIECVLWLFTNWNRHQSVFHLG